MNKIISYAGRLKIGLAVALLAVLAGCAGYVDGGGYGGVVVAPGPYIYGDFYDRGIDVHAYSHRGFQSRAIAHPGGFGRGGKR